MVINMEWNDNVFGTFIKVDKGTEGMIEWLQRFYLSCYDVNATPADILGDAVFDLFIRTLGEESNLKE